MDLSEIDELCKLVSKHKLDRLVVDGVEIYKSKYDAPEQKAVARSVLVEEQDFDELLFHSTSAPMATIEDLEQFTVTNLKAKK